MKFILLGTLGCHLCEEAETLINQCLELGNGITVETIDIAEYPQWQKEYALLIPVFLHEESSQFLAWPFAEIDIIHFVNTFKP